MTSAGVRGPTEKRRALAARVREMRDIEGLLYRDIVERLAISYSYAQALYTDPDGVKQRARRDSYDGVCVDCGGVTKSNGTSRPSDWCEDCGRHASKVWTREAIIDAIKRWADAHGGEPPTATQWKFAAADHPAGTTVYHDMFASWGEAIEAAGFPRPRQGQRPGDRWWTPELVVATLLDLATDGVAPSSAADPGLWYAARECFGSWPEACVTAGLKVRGAHCRKWPREAVLSWLRDHSVDGVAPSSRHASLTESGMYSAINRYYGSWAAACEAAGVEPRSRSGLTAAA